MQIARETIPNLPLAGLRVVDLSRLLPGPWCTQTLGDMGADVIKIEQLEIGDQSRHNPPNYRSSGVYFNGVNRNKRSIALDFNRKSDHSIAGKLLRDADVVVESFRPGVTAKYGFDYASVSQDNPGIIYCSLTGFGGAGSLSNVPGHDLSIQGMTGLLGHVTGSGGLPAMPSLQAADYAGAAYAAISILGAYIRRGRNGEGCHLDISLYDSLMGFSQISLAAALARFSGQSGRPGLEAWGQNPRYAIYPTRDGKAVTAALLETRTWHRFCRIIERPDLISDESLTARLSLHDGQQEIYRSAIASVCSAHDRDDLVQRMMSAGIPICPIYSPDEALVSPEAQARQVVMTVDDAREGTLPHIIDPITRTGLGKADGRLAPALDEHGDELRRELDGTSLP